MVKTTCISYERYRGYIYFSKSSDIGHESANHCQPTPTSAMSVTLVHYISRPIIGSEISNGAEFNVLTPVIYPDFGYGYVPRLRLRSTINDPRALLMLSKTIRSAGESAVSTESMESMDSSVCIEYRQFQ